MKTVPKKLYQALRKIQKLAASAQALDTVEMSKVLDEIEVTAIAGIKLHQKYDREEPTDGSAWLRQQQEVGERKLTTSVG